MDIENELIKIDQTEVIDDYFHDEIEVFSELTELLAEVIDVIENHLQAKRDCKIIKDNILHKLREGLNDVNECLIDFNQSYAKFEMDINKSLNVGWIIEKIREDKMLKEMEDERI